MSEQDETHTIMRLIAKAFPPRDVKRWVVFYPNAYAPTHLHVLAAFSRVPRWL